MHIDADLLILGGGCAGLSLGQRLAERPSGSRRTLIVERRATYTNDRSWCFWRFGNHRHDHLVTHTWSKMKVASHANSFVADCGRTPYQMLHALPFYTEACSTINSAPHVELICGTRLLEPPLKVGELWHVQTNQGQLVARKIVDTTPPSAPIEGDAVLWQSFFGQEVMCEHPVFDPNNVTLMDFSKSSEHGILFHYVLPVSTTRALVETTVFGPRPLAVTDLAGVQADAITRLCNGRAVDVLRSENGILPMGMRQSPLASQSGYVRAGLMSGGARPSTGYAFQRIQSWAEAAATQITDGIDPSTHRQDPLIWRLMDRLFLRVIRAHPDRGAELFLNIFGAADTTRVIRFLSDKGTLVDCGAVVASLPKGLFLRELWQSLLEPKVKTVGVA